LLHVVYAKTPGDARDATDEEPKTSLPVDELVDSAIAAVEVKT
jgi:hypothetical protein